MGAIVAKPTLAVISGLKQSPPLLKHCGKRGVVERWAEQQRELTDHADPDRPFRRADAANAGTRPA